MLSSFHHSSDLPTTAADVRPSPPGSAVRDCRPLVVSLLQLMRPLLSHKHEHLATATSVTADGRDTNAHHTCTLCRLLQYLCHWMAARIALPERMAEHFLVLWRTRQGIPRGGGLTDPTFADEAEDDGADRYRRSGVAGYCPSTNFAESSAACLLPAFNPREHSAILEGSELQCSAAVSSKRPVQVHDALLQRYIDLLFQLLHSKEASCNDDGMSAAARPSTCPAAELLEVYQMLKNDEMCLVQPTQLSNEHIALLLQIYTSSLVSLAALALHRVLPSASPPLSPDEKLSSVADAFRRLLNAQQSARAAVRYCSSSPCDELLRTRIQPLLAVLTLVSTPTASTPTRFVHPHVELSADPLYCVSGCGLVATGALQEGELLLVEECLLALPVADHVSDGATPVEREASTLADAVEKTLPSVKETEKLLCEGTEAEAPSCCNDALSTVDYVIDALSRHPPSFAETWWYRWAIVLSETLRPGAARSSTSLHKSMRACVKEALLAASCPSRKSPTSPENASVSEDSASSALALRLLPVREVDELHLPRPLSDGASLHVFNDFLSPALNPLPSDALFCMLHFANHACAPNAVVVYDADPARSSALIGSLVPLRDIEAGEEITISYVPATTALTVSQAELTAVLGFECRCSLCTQKAALLHGAVCSECKQLVWASPREGVSAAALSKKKGVDLNGRLVGTSAFVHSTQCSHYLRRPDCECSRGYKSEEPGSIPSSVAGQLRRQLDRISAQVSAAGYLASTQEEGGSSSTCGAADDCACHDLPHSTAAIKKDPLVAAVRQLVDLDDCVAHALLPTHHLRLRTRLEAFAYATVAEGLGSTVSAQLIQLCARTIEELEVLLGPNHPLLTGLRMHLVFSRGRHVQAVQTAETLAHGTRQADCCGAVREQAALMELPFVLDPLVRRCVMRCFQEHYVQLVGWKLPLLANATEDGVLRSFLCRYPVELAAAGISTLEHMELLACMEDGEGETV
ncbi:hypothetical protein ABL78_3103 [Leptomonas seymouri]|uniref:SET domain-containing protein n=1 Tax=Leptomonas seymouri TaxID=5684 RepID=A0A0N1PEX7_LEPSE|nr:hypothetical protein ABL78_3103 [Leptomonas seymouri]|eukprot:KPI87804.1 hypothetical protein ABL78_3103 [Leptomonas seymouri]